MAKTARAVTGWSKQITRQDFSQNSIVITGLNWCTGRRELEQHFKKYGSVISSFVFMNRYRGVSRGMSLLKFKDSSGLDNVLKTNDHVVDGKRVKVEISRK